MSATFTFRAEGRSREARVVERLDRIGALQWARKFCRELGAHLDEVIGRSHARHITRVRHRLWCVLRDTLALSYPVVAGIFEVDHSTVMWAERKLGKGLAA